MTQRTALIVGASSGLGAAMHARFVERGWRCIGTSRSPERHPGDLESLDVRDETSVQGLAQRLGPSPPDVVVLNAGFGIAGPVEHTTVDEAIGQLDTNLLGVHRLVRIVLPAMRRRQSGTIIIVGSIASRLAVPFQAFYCASKAAVASYARVLDMEVRAHGVRIHLVEPGDHNTGFTAARTLVGLGPGDSYEPDCSRAVESMASNERSGGDPARLARRVERLARSNRTGRRLTVVSAMERMILVLSQVLPARLLTRMTMRVFGVRGRRPTP